MQQRILQLGWGDALQRQLNHGSLDTPNRHFSSRHPYLASNVSQGNSPLAGWGTQKCNAGNFSRFLFARDNLGSRCNCRPAFHQKAGKLAMHVAARANALHYLLSNVASLVEIEGAHLLRFLGQVALANVHAIKWDASCDALDFQRLTAHRDSSGGDQRLPSRMNILRGEPNLVALCWRILAAYNRTAHTATFTVATRSDHLQGLQFRNFDSGGIQNGT